MGPRSNSASSNVRSGARSRVMAMQGFTLAELMVVVVLVSIMTALIIPEMRGTYEEALLRSTGRKLVAALNLAHSQSITTQERHRLRIDTSDGRYFLERAPRESASRFVPVPNVPGSEGALDKRITIEIRKAGLSENDGEAEPGEEPQFGTLMPDEEISAVRDSVNFAPDGTADPLEIILRDRHGFGLSLRVNPTTARVQISELDRK